MENNNEYHRKYRAANADKIKEIKLRYRLKNEAKIKEYRLNNRDYQKEYQTENKERINQWRTNKRNSDPLYKLKYNISCAIRSSFRNKKYIKKSKTEKILGCSFEEFKRHIEKKFDSKMNWENQGSYWHLDHIKPISLAKNESEVKKLNHYTNFQPLEATENIVKRNKFPFERGMLVNIKINKMKLFTDYPITELGDKEFVEAPIRECKLLSYDDNKYCYIKVGEIKKEVKRGYIYTKSGRCGEVDCISIDEINALLG